MRLNLCDFKTDHLNRYVPARANWNKEGGMPPKGDSPPDAMAELATTTSHHSPTRRRVNSGGSDTYYEDVDPRFASDPEPVPQPPLPVQHEDMPRYVNTQIPIAHSYEDLPGARSPAESEASNFTSVSQRGVNPNWRPGNGGEFNSFAPPRRHQQQMRRDVLLNNNPDFELPGMGPPRGMPGRGRGGMRGGMTMGPGRPLPANAVGGVDGRYPSPVPGPGMGTREI